MGSRQRSCPKPLSPTRRQPGLPLRASRSASQARCAQVLPDPAVQLSAATFVGIREGVRGASLERNRCVRVSAPVSGSFPPPQPPCSQAGSGSLGRGGGRFWPVPPPSCPAPGPRFRRPGADGRRPARLPAPGPVCSDGRGSQSQGGRGKPARARALRPAPGRPTLRLKTSRSSSLRSRRSGSSPPPSDPGVQTSALLPQNLESRLQPALLLQTLRVQTPHLLV